jgi:cell division cycle 20-like protein 1, cofactor of APC complex
MGEKSIQKLNKNVK